jgi:hypothetical protein
VLNKAAGALPTNDGLKIYVRPGERIECPDGLKLVPVEFGNGHITFKVSHPDAKVRRKRSGPAHVLTLEGFA